MDTLSLLLQFGACVCLFAGGAFALIGALGLVRLPDFFMRLHTPTLASTLGVGGVLLGSLLLAWAQGEPNLRVLLIAAFMGLTAPVSANALAQAALLQRLPSRAPLPH